MRKYIGLLLVVVITAMMMAGCNKADESEGIVKKAEQLIQFISEGKYEKATEHFNQEVGEVLTSTSLEELWGTLNEQAGKYIDHEYDSIEQRDGYETVLINGLFEGTDVKFFVTFDDEEQIAGFFIK